MVIGPLTLCVKRKGQNPLPDGRPLERPASASVVGEVLEFSPPHRYAHTMKFTQYEDAPCTVIYELTEVEGGTDFKLIKADNLRCM